MLNDTKHLSVQSFQRNQGLLEALNNYIIFIKLKAQGLDGKFKAEKIEEARDKILSFLNRLNMVISTDEKEEVSSTTRLLGLDSRFKSLVSEFTEARGRTGRYKSVLFRKNPSALIELMEKEGSNDSKALIQSLTELGSLIEDHLSKDTKEVIGDI